MLVRGMPAAATAELRQPTSVNENHTAKSSEFGAWLRKQRSTEATPEGQRASRSDDDGKAKSSAEETHPARTSEEARSDSQQSKAAKSDKTVTKSDAKTGAETSAKLGDKTDPMTDAKKKKSANRGTVVRGDVPRSRELKTSARNKRGAEPKRGQGKSVQAQNPSGSVASKDEATATKAVLRGAAHARVPSKAKEKASRANTQGEKSDDSESRPRSGEAANQTLTVAASSSREVGEESGRGESTSLKAEAAKTGSRGRTSKNGGLRRDSSPADSDSKTDGRQTRVADVRGDASPARGDTGKPATPDRVPAETDTKPVHLRTSAQTVDTEATKADSSRVSATPVRVDVSAPAPSDGSVVSPKAAAPFHQLVEQGLNELLSSPQGAMVRQLQLQLSGEQSAHIRLSLHPESLGEVRLSVQLHERSAITQIRVDNAQTGQLMENALESFARSFSDNGYHQQRFEVVVEQRRAGRSNEAGAAHSVQARPLAQILFDQQQINYMA